MPASLAFDRDELVIPSLHMALTHQDNVCTIQCLENPAYQTNAQVDSTHGLFARDHLSIVSQLGHIMTCPRPGIRMVGVYILRAGVLYRGAYYRDVRHCFPQQVDTVHQVLIGPGLVILGDAIIEIVCLPGYLPEFQRLSTSQAYMKVWPTSLMATCKRVFILARMNDCHGLAG